MQQIMLTVSQAWGGVLTAANRLTYTNVAKSVIWQDRFGDPYIPNGYQLYMKWNIRRQLMSLAIMTMAPPEQPIEYIDELRYGVSIPGPFIRVRLAKTPLLNPESYGVEYYKAGPYDSGGRHPTGGEWLFQSLEVPPAFWDDYAVVFNKWYWYRSRQVSEFGYVGNWFEIQVQFA